jgi:hypothetical protein
MQQMINLFKKDILSRLSWRWAKQERADSRGQCYDRHFERFLPIFGEKLGVFLKKQCYDAIFAQFK